jgi:hypothetical protein
MEEAVVAPAVERRRKVSLYGTAFAAAAFVAMSILFATQTTWYFVFKEIHVGAAVIWVGGGLFITICALLAELANVDSQLLQIGYRVDKVAARVFPVMSFVVLGFGIAMTANADIGYDQFWIVFGLIAWAASAATGILYLSPESKRLTKAIVSAAPKIPRCRCGCGGS